MPFFERMQYTPPIKKYPPLILFQLYELVLVFSCGRLSPRLYYQNVSSDGMSLAIGRLMTYAELIALAVASVVAAVVKTLRHRRSS